MLLFGWLPLWSTGSVGTAVTIPPFVDEPPLFCDPIYSDAYKGIAAVWYGGGWREKRPVTGLATAELDDFARSADLTPAKHHRALQLRRRAPDQGVCDAEEQLQRAREVSRDAREQ